MSNPLYDVITAEERATQCDTHVLIKASNKDIQFKVSANIADKVKAFTWTCHNCRTDDKPFFTLHTQKSYDGIRYCISLSQFIMGRVPDEYDVIDHINWDRLDNTSQNLRFATYAANSQNVDRELSTSSFIGVKQRSDVFQAYAKIDSVTCYFGTYLTKEVAAYAYDCAVLQFHGQGARVNGVSKSDCYEWDQEDMLLKQVAPVAMPVFNRNSTGYKGVDNLNGQFRANIRLKEKSIWLGTFDRPEVAAYAHNCMALKLYGDKAQLNNVPKPDGFTWDPKKDKLVKHNPKQYAKIRSGGTGYRGVTKVKNGYVACIYVNGKRIHLGLYETAEVAALAFNKALRHYYPNDPDLRFNTVALPEENYEWNSTTKRLTVKT